MKTKKKPHTQQANERNGDSKCELHDLYSSSLLLSCLSLSRLRARARTSLSLSLSLSLSHFSSFFFSSSSLPSLSVCLSVCLWHRRISFIFSLSTSQQRRSLLTHDRLKMRHATSWHKDQSGDDAFGWLLQTSSPTTTVDNVLSYSSFSILPTDIIHIRFTPQHHQRAAIDNIFAVTLLKKKYGSHADQLVDG